MFIHPSVSYHTVESRKFGDQSRTLLTPAFRLFDLRPITSRLAPQQILQSLGGVLSSPLADGRGQWNLFLTHFDAVLRVATVGNPSLAHHDREAIVFVHRSGRV